MSSRWINSHGHYEEPNRLSCAWFLQVDFFFILPSLYIIHDSTTAHINNKLKKRLNTENASESRLLLKNASDMHAIWLCTLFLIIMASKIKKHNKRWEKKTEALLVPMIWGTLRKDVTSCKLFILQYKLVLCSCGVHATIWSDLC